MFCTHAPLVHLGFYIQSFELLGNRLAFPFSHRRLILEVQTTNLIDCDQFRYGAVKKKLFQDDPILELYQSKSLLHPSQKG